MQRCVPSLATKAQQLGLALTDPALAQALDAADPLAAVREEFIIPGADEGQAYLCAHALGPQPKGTAALITEELAAWAVKGCHGHTEHPTGKPWTLGGGIDERYTDVLADIVGAKQDEVTLMGGLTGNLHVLMTSFYRPDKSTGRHKLIFEANAFPSDLFAFNSQIRLAGYDPATSLIGLHPRAGEERLRTADILAAIEEHGSETSLVLFAAVQWYTGQLFEMEVITKKAHEHGALVGWDCAHAAGNVEMALHDWGVDFACWCNYKYLNSGPGATAAIFVHEKHFDRLRLAGWWGHEIGSHFGSAVPFKPRRGAKGFALNNPSLFGTIPVHTSLDIMRRVPSIYAAGSGVASTPPSTDGPVGTGSIMPLVRSKSILLTGYLELLLTSKEVMGASSRLRVISPGEEDQRGSCLCVLFIPKEGDEDLGSSVNYSATLLHVFTTLTDAGVIVNKRAPDLIRFAPSALYNTFEEVRRAALAVKEALQ